MSPNLYARASERINDLIENSEDQKVKSQAEVYQAVIHLNSDVSDDIDLWKEIQSIDESGDAFLEGKKLLLTAIYHLKKGNIDECEKFLRKVEGNEKYGDILKLESYYYQMISVLRSSNLTETEKLNITNDLLNRLQDKLKSISPEFVFIDMVKGEKREKNEIENEIEKRIAEEKARKQLIEEEKIKKLEEEERRRKEEEEAERREERKKEIYRQFNELKIGVIYNRFSLNNQVIANEDVKQKALGIGKQIGSKFPNLKSRVTVKALEMKYVNQKIGYQKDNYYYNLDDEASSLLYEELKNENIVTSWKFVYERLLRDRYPEFDFVIVIGRE